MKIHEYQAKELLAKYGVPIPQGMVARTASEAEKIAAEIGKKVVIKSQVHSGGRGKAGGIKITESPVEAGKLAAELIGKKLVTGQSGPQGLPVNSVLVEEAVGTERELYISVVMDSIMRMPMLMASAAGGMEIEEIAEKSPEKILKAYADPIRGFYPYQAREIAFGLDLKGDQFKTCVKLMPLLCKLFSDKDCSLVEINPLIVTNDGRLLAADAKVNFDDNALFRHKDIEELYDESQEDALEIAAKESNIQNYIKLSGNIGCIVNGAGLAMAVLDTLKLAGGEAANFLDIGTVNDSNRVVGACRIISSDPDVKAVFVNIFGGIARVDVIANGLVEAAKELGDKMPPTVVRLAGTNADVGEKIIAESGIHFIRATTFQEAAEKAVAAAKN